MKDMLEENKEGKNLLPSEKVVEFSRKFLEKRQPATGPPKTHRLGPCATVVTKDPSEYIKKRLEEYSNRIFHRNFHFAACRSRVRNG